MKLLIALALAAAPSALAMAPYVPITDEPTPAPSETCYCATACPETFGGDQGLIAGPCDADEPLKKVGTGGAESRETAPPAPEE